ncbi:uncharacterized protein LOC27207842 isoform X2 [Drosophila simulans]|uniref:uncharacterized protein LOC27207842 isoform X2 n=1 Tax=Drosophila simulans TaxID=7240 RepID=UPI00078AE0E3|nr:uncharacterized protein LOC27207842 isoform X2 [Drosophila simulans]KMZ04963.1 uncharacterized protein Dsimw501_GD29018 [Drosophila simulans]
MLLPTLILSSLSVRSRFEVMMLAILLVLLVFASQIEALPAGKDSSGKDAKLPLISKPPLQQQLNPLNQDEVTMFTNMFLSLFRGVADYRNMVAADSVQSVWQSPPVVDFSHRLFAS